MEGFREVLPCAEGEYAGYSDGDVMGVCANGGLGEAACPAC